MLTCKKIELRRYKEPTIKNLTFQLNPGEICAIVGPVGVGKKTLLQGIVGLLPLRKGAIKIHSLSLTQNRQSFLKSIFYIESPRHLSGDLTVKHHLAMVKKEWCSTKDMAVVSRMFALTPHLNKRLNQLSRERKVQVMMALYVMSDCPVMMFNELLTLHLRNKAALKKLLVYLQKNGKTVLFTTSSLYGLSELCHRVFFLHQGQIAYIAQPDEDLMTIYHHFYPAKPRQGEEI